MPSAISSASARARNSSSVICSAARIAALRVRYSCDRSSRGPPGGLFALLTQELGPVEQVLHPVTGRVEPSAQLCVFFLECGGVSRSLRRVAGGLELLHPRLCRLRAPAPRRHLLA